MTSASIASPRGQHPASPSTPTPTAPSPSLPPILQLPPELIDHLLTQVPPDILQLTALALTRVFPDHFISKRHLWKHLVVYRAGQLMPLWRKLQEDEGMRDGVRTFCMQSWRGDADILNNVMRRLNNIHALMLNIGTNFAPEHLEEMFIDPRQGLERMELRFRPYVEQASYYQFLKGSYFDTAIETLTKSWPSTPSFTHLSIVQDLPPRSTVPPTARNSARNSAAASLSNSFADLRLAEAGGTGAGAAPANAAGTGGTASTSDSEHSDRSTPPTSASDDLTDPADPTGLAAKRYTGHGPFGNPYLNEKAGLTRPKSFAQPIVFFDIQCLAKFGAAAVAEHLTHLRLRVPSRDLARVLTMSPPRGAHSETIFPELRYLDISTTNVRLDTTLSALLRQYSKLEHLVLDRVNLFGFMARDKGQEMCNDLGGVIVSAGLARGKERERQIAAWELGERTRAAEAAAEAARQAAGANNGQGGTGGGPTVFETEFERVERERREEMERNVEAARARRGHRSAAMSTFSLRDRPRRGASALGSSSSTATAITLPPPDKLYLVLPPLPTLKSINIGGEAHSLSSAKIAEWEIEFHAGWKEGLGRLSGWAVHVADKYERARRKAEEWRLSEDKGGGKPAGPGAKHAPAKGKARATPAAAAKAATKPPTDVRLFRFPTPSEKPTISGKPGLYNLTAGLIEITPDDPEHANRGYLDPYKQALADAQLFEDKQTGVGAPCVICTVPDCEGPARRGEEGEKMDGRGGMGGVHRGGCGHLVGRSIWGWNGV
ncbi:hypothetical protein IAT38_000996 [Cryptococcus sp. DSM 104549]